MANWTYQDGFILAYCDAGNVLCAIPAQPMFGFLADLLNANERLSNLILEGYGVVQPVRSVGMVI